MANIRINIDHKKTKGYIFLIYDIRPGTRVKISLRRSVPVGAWDVAAHRVAQWHPDSAQINKYITFIVSGLEKYITDHRRQRRHINVRMVRDYVHKLMKGGDTHHVVVNLSMQSYFDRCYGMLGDNNNWKQIYEIVEQEWNDQGIVMCPSYDAFRKAKERYLKHRKEKQHRYKPKEI